MAATIEIVIDDPAEDRAPADGSGGGGADGPAGGSSRGRPRSDSGADDPLDPDNWKPLGSTSASRELRDAMRERIAEAKEAARERASLAREAARDAARQAREAKQAASAAARQAKQASSALARDARRAAAQAAKEAKQEAAAAAKQARETARDARRTAAEAAREAKRTAAEQKREKSQAAKRAARTGAEMARMRQKAQAQQRREQATEQRRQHAAQQRNAAAVAAAGASIARGGGPGAAVGSAVGGAVGSRFGPAGAIAGAAVGEAAGKFADNPLAGPAEFGTKVARGDAMGALTGAADKAAMGLALIPGAGLPAAMALKTFTAVANSAVEVMGAFAARGREISGYSGQIAAAAATQDVARIMSDIKEAQKLGDLYAKTLQAQTRFEETLKAGLIPLKEVILEHLPRVMDYLLQLVISSARTADKINPFGDLFKKMADEAEKTRKALEGPGVGLLPMIDAWVAAAAGMRLVEPALGAAGVPAVGAPAFAPIVGGP